jgi:hypothetical protein
MFLALRLRRAFTISALASISLSLHAQVDTGTVLGTVRDNTGAVIANAQVTVRNEDTGVSQTKSTGAGGDYIFTPLRIGKYSIEVENAGFKKERRTSITVDIQQQAVADFTLTVGDVSSEIQVTACC